MGGTPWGWLRVSRGSIVLCGNFCLVVVQDQPQKVEKFHFISPTFVWLRKNLHVKGCQWKGGVRFNSWMYKKRRHYGSTYFVLHINCSYSNASLGFSFRKGLELIEFLFLSPFFSVVFSKNPNFPSHLTDPLTCSNFICIQKIQWKPSLNISPLPIMNFLFFMFSIL